MRRYYNNIPNWVVYIPIGLGMLALAAGVCELFR